MAIDCLCLGGRAAIHEAKAMLESAGYETERVISNPRKFDLIAWKGKETLCIVIRPSRYLKPGSWGVLFRSLVFLVRNQAVPGAVQFWIYRTPGWDMWEITSGGARPMKWSGPNAKR